MINIVSLGLASVLGAGGVISARAQAPAGVAPPPIVREFRGVWITTVYNVDWPSKPGLPAPQQKAEMLAILNKAQQLRLNAVVLQVRTMCDAMYASQIEPWSHFLTGTMGQAPSPRYDPLVFALEEAHRRGIELHAWFNPFRVNLPDRARASSQHVSVRQTSLVRQHGEYLWLDPGEKQAQDYTMSVLLDVVRRYNVDGIHIDDYFYPPGQRDAKGNAIDFNDATSWNRYKSGGGKLERNDWRRNNINEFIKRLYTETKKVKPWVKLGISPPGIWRPGFPPQIKGRDVFQAIYADSRKWLQEGWCDYFVPQLYWRIEDTDQSYPVLLKWWTEQNLKGRHVWAGTAIGNVGKGWPSDEITRQIQISRQQKGSAGNIHYHTKPLLGNRGGICDALARAYPQPALVPASPWLMRVPVPKPALAVATVPGGRKLTWRHGTGGKAWQWVLQKRIGNDWFTEIFPGAEDDLVLKGTPNSPLPNVVAVTCVDRVGNASPPEVLSLR